MAIEKFQQKFIQLIIPVFEGAIEDRKKYYLENPPLRCIYNAAENQNKRFRYIIDNF